MKDLGKEGGHPRLNTILEESVKNRWDQQNKSTRGSQNADQTAIVNFLL